MRAALVVLGVVVTALAAAHAADEPLPEVMAALDRIKSASTVELTTTGRKSGKSHSKPVWFVVEDGKIIVQAGKDGKTDWYRNMVKTPTAVVRQGGYRFRVRAVMVDDPARIEAVHRLFVDKYTTAWLLSFLGSSIGQGRPVELVPVSVRGSSAREQQIERPALARASGPFFRLCTRAEEEVGMGADDRRSRVLAHDEAMRARCREVSERARWNQTRVGRDRAPRRELHSEAADGFALGEAEERVALVGGEHGVALVRG